jgi:hypothetical protein
MAERSDADERPDAGESAKEKEANRYRKAAEDALQQLDWCIGYLHGIHKVDVSRALAKNRSFIRRNLMGRPEEPLPTQQTKQR